MNFGAMRSGLRFCDARRFHAFLHCGLLRRGVSLRQGVPEAEVAHESYFVDRPHSLHSAAGIPDRRPAFPGEILR